MDNHAEKCNQLIQNINKAPNLKDLDQLSLEIFQSKNGFMAKLLENLKSAPPEQKREFGQRVNEIKTLLTTTINQRKANLRENAEDEYFDVTLPSNLSPKLALNQAASHPLSDTINEIEDIFTRLGFNRRRFRETEWEDYAFTKLNMPQDHPARDEWETFYLGRENQVITPHTSNGQIREMENRQPPIRMINISRCGRRQEDLTHVPTFYQFEGLLIDTAVSITDLKGVLEYFVHKYFGKDRQIRLRPYDFRFTEPSFEIDISCGVCGGEGCRSCKEGWMELGGAGMVHPNVLRQGHIDPNIYQGFAFGWGVERVFAMRNPEGALPDIRVLYNADLRFLRIFQ